MESCGVRGLCILAGKWKRARLLCHSTTVGGLYHKQKKTATLAYKARPVGRPHAPLIVFVPLPQGPATMSATCWRLLPCRSPDPTPSVSNPRSDQGEGAS